MPIVYFLLPNMHTGCILTIHVLRKIQVTTGRRIILISNWPFWPADTFKDKLFTSFVQGLTPKFHYVWIPLSLQSFILNFMNLLARVVQKHVDLYQPAGMQSTVRWGSSSTMLHSDILNQGSRVLLHIPKSHEDDLETQVEELGVPPGGWFVCAHAREHGWFKELDAYHIRRDPSYSHDQEDVRNVDIEDYYPAFNHVVSMGGTVIRMGDTSMKPIVGIDGVIDYPFTKQKSLLMDLYLVAKCRFVLGCNTGFSSFPVAFGTPLLITNFTSVGNSGSFPYSNNIFLFKHIIDIGSGKRLDFKRNFDPNLCTLNDTLHFAAQGCRCQANSPDEILEATKEILDLIENDSFDKPRSVEQERFHQYRLQTRNIWSPLKENGFDPLHFSESRISATFAASNLSSE